MAIGTYLVGAALIVGMASSGVALAADTRSGGVLPAARPAAIAPMSGVRRIAPLRHRSMQSDADAPAASHTGLYIAGGVGAAAIIGGIVVIASDHDDTNNNSSPG